MKLADVIDHDAHKLIEEETVKIEVSIINQILHFKADVSDPSISTNTSAAVKDGL